MCDAGNIVVFTSTGGMLVPEATLKAKIDELQADKNKIDLTRHRGVYTFDMFLRKPDAPKHDSMNSIETKNQFNALDDEESLFKRQGTLLFGQRM